MLDICFADSYTQPMTCFFHYFKLYEEQQFQIMNSKSFRQKT